MDFSELKARVGSWLQWWKWALIVVGALLGAVARVVGGEPVTGAVAEFVRVLVILTVYVLIATAIWRGLKAVVNRVRGRGEQPESEASN